jgi:hypothetical protein
MKHPEWVPEWGSYIFYLASISLNCHALSIWIIADLNTQSTEGRQMLTGENFTFSFLCILHAEVSFVQWLCSDRGHSVLLCCILFHALWSGVITTNWTENVFKFQDISTYSSCYYILLLWLILLFWVVVLRGVCVNVSVCSTYIKMFCPSILSSLKAYQPCRDGGIWWVLLLHSVRWSQTSVS